QLGRLEEREGERLLSLAQDVQGERLVLLDEGVSVRVSLDADRDEGRLERCWGNQFTVAAATCPPLLPALRTEGPEGIIRSAVFLAFGSIGSSSGHILSRTTRRQPCR